MGRNKLDTVQTKATRVLTSLDKSAVSGAPGPALDTNWTWNCLRGTPLDWAVKVIFKEMLLRKKNPA